MTQGATVNSVDKVNLHTSLLLITALQHTVRNQAVLLCYDSCIALRKSCSAGHPRMPWSQSTVWELHMPHAGVITDNCSPLYSSGHSPSIRCPTACTLQSPGSRVCPAEGGRAIALQSILQWSACLSQRHADTSVCLQLMDGRHYLVRVSVHIKTADLPNFNRTVVSCPPD